MIKKQLFIMSLAVIFVLLVSAINPSAAYADEEPTTDTPTETITTDEDEGETEETGSTDTEEGETSDETAETGSTDTEEGETSDETAEAGSTDSEEGEASENNSSGSDDTGTTEDDSTGSGDGENEEADTSSTDEPILEQVPDNTSVVVINEDGESEPLATQDAADAIATSDPIWCPVGQPPIPGENGCTGTFASFDELLTFLKANEGDAAYQQAGVIYVAMGDYATSESSIDFNEYEFDELVNYDLTIQGGWDTTTNTTEPTESTTFNVSITIGSSDNPWVGSLIFNNIKIEDLFEEDALTAYSQDDITLTNVEITNIEDGTAATLTSTEGDVTITGGTFSESETGAVITAAGDVTIEGDVQFNDNDVAGAVISAGGNVDISDSTFNNNGEVEKKTITGQGLEIASAGTVTLNNVQANENKVFGANITADGSVTISNSFFSGNHAYTSAYCGDSKYAGYGLQVVSQDSIVLDTVEANENYLFGAYLEAADQVTVTDSTFNENGSSSTKYIDGKGLEVKSGNTVTLTNVQANGNRLFGADIDAVGTVRITDSVFSGNKSYTCLYCGGKTYYGYGLQVISLDSIYLDGVDASDNNLFGAYLDAVGEMEIFDSTFNDNGSISKDNIDGKGLEVKGGATVTLQNVLANGNRQFGADITAVGDVTIRNSVFSGNKSYTCSYCGGRKYYGYGLSVVTLENITLDSVTASENYLFGAYLDAAGSVAISNSIFSNNGNNGSDSWESIDGKGLEVKSGGYVSLYNVEANNNRQFGADITAANSVAIYQGFFSGNKAYTWSYCGGHQYYGYGLRVVTLGDISLDEVNANENFLYGAYLEAIGDVAISNSTFNKNVTDTSFFIDDTGLIVKSGGNVALSNVEANENRLAGADIYAAGDVAIRNSFFSGNKGYTSNYCGCTTYHGYGLQVISLGSIALDGVTASDNYLFGAYLDAAGDVAIMDSFFNNNGSDSWRSIDGRGLEVKSGGYVSLYKVEANNNRQFGADITANNSVAISSSFFSGNMDYTCNYCGGLTFYGYGLQVVSAEVITLDDVVASDNYLFGANLEAGSDVNVNNSIFNNNRTPYAKNLEGKGLTVKSGGNVTLENVQANDNHIYGADIHADGSVDIRNSTFSGNNAYYVNNYCGGIKYYGYGLQVVAMDDISLTGVTATDNYLFGTRLETTGNVEIFDSVFSNNGTDSTKTILGRGLEIRSGGTVTLENVEANNNRLFGADIITTGPVTIRNSFFSGNQAYRCSYCGWKFEGYGLQVVTSDEIVLENVTANDNHLFGARLISETDIEVTDSFFDNNGMGTSGKHARGNGLEITGGNVYLDNVQANGNRLTGAMIEATGEVGISNSIFSFSLHGNGLSVTAGGEITLTNVTAANNDLDGAYLKGACTTVTVTGGTFADNGQYGLEVIDGKLILIDSPIFANNGAGNIFEDPGTCIFIEVTDDDPGASDEDPGDSGEDTGKTDEDTGDTGDDTGVTDDDPGVTDEDPGVTDDTSPTIGDENNSVSQRYTSVINWRSSHPWFNHSWKIRYHAMIKYWGINMSYNHRWHHYWR